MGGISNGIHTVEKKVVVVVFLCEGRGSLTIPKFFTNFIQFQFVMYCCILKYFDGNHVLACIM